MSCDARGVANFLLDIADDRQRPITHLWLQKAIFFSHGWHLALKSEPLIKDPTEAWKMGPVYRSVYRCFKASGDEHINNRAEGLDLTTGEYRKVESFSQKIRSSY